MPTDDAADAARAHGLPWPILPAFLPVLYLWIGWSWWVEIRYQLEAVAESVPSMDRTTLAAAAVAGRALALLSESAVYALWWKSRRLRLPFWRFVCWVAALSTADLLGFSLRRAVEDAPDVLRMLGAVIAGPAAVNAAIVSGTGSNAAFGNFGVLTLLRVGITAWAQARGIGQSLGGPLLLTTALWLLTRLIGWWSVDLVKGLSPVP